MQVQPAELPTTTLQELKQRVHQLLLSQRTLQQQMESLTADCDALRIERDTLAIQLQQLQDQQEVVRQECERAVQERESAARDALLSALRHVFPYSAYRQQRPDLDSFSDHDLLDHFVSNGIHEGVTLLFSELEAELLQLRSSLEEANAKAELSKQKSSHTAAQLEVLKDLFTKMTVQP